MPHDVFAYGQFLKEPVLKRMLGRVPKKVPAKLRGYRKFLDDILGFYNLVVEEEGVVEGELLTWYGHRMSRGLEVFSGLFG